MNDSPEVLDLGQYVEDAVTLSGDPKKLIAKKMVNAYTKGTIAAITTATLGLGVVPAGPTITTQQPIRKPNEHAAVQAHGDTVTHNLGTLVGGSTDEERMWSDDDSTPMWSGNDFAPFWGTRADRVRFTRRG